MFKQLFSSLKGSVVPVETTITAKILVEMENFISKNQELIHGVIDRNEYTALLLEYNKLKDLNLHNTKNAKLIQEKLNAFNGMANDILLAKELIAFIVDARSHFGEHTLLISNEVFVSLCDKYNLTVGTLDSYTGVVPEKNIQEIANVREKMASFKGYRCLNTLIHNNLHVTLGQVTGIHYYHSTSNSDRKLLENYVNSLNSIVPIDLHYGRGETMVLKCEFTPKNLRNIELSGISVSKLHDDLLIAAPKSELRQQSLEIKTVAKDPIVFHRTPYGILIHSMWGEESEDVIFEEYKKINNLLL